MTQDPTYDALIIGGGPAGATAALRLARGGLKPIILERSPFPRFHIGESFLPRNLTLIQDLDLEPALRALPHVPKYGAEFIMGDNSNSTRFRFDPHFCRGASETFNLERAPFDQMLLDEARKAGAELRQPAQVREILKLTDGDVAVSLSTGQTLRGRYLLDASGQATVVARHLGTRRPCTEKHLQKVAYFAHYENVRRLPGDEAGHPTIVIADEAWFWLIPVNETVMSIGCVMDAEIARTLDVPANQLLNWAIRRCPAIADRCRHATFPPTNQVIANFSYRCKPYAGPGYFLLGDAATFLDPIFSTGVCLGMMTAVQAADHVKDILSNTITPAAARKRYINYIRTSTKPFWKLIKAYYRHPFRELFLNGEGPLQVHKAVLAVLAGHVFPKPAFYLRWRLAAFHVFLNLQEFLPLVPRRQRFSLLNTPPVDFPDAHFADHPVLATA